MRPKVKLLLLALVVFVIATNIVIACPTCKEGMANDPHQASMIHGYFWSILFMMSMPFLIFTSLATYFYLLVRSARKAQPLVLATQS